MRYAVAPLALAAFVAATPVPQGVTESIAPDASAPAGCQTSYSGTFNIQIVNQSDATARRSIHKRQSNILSLSLADGVLTDSQGRTGYIAANSQFQFDAPPQTGAIYTAGWSVCPNNRLTLGDDDGFYSCLSGNFYNLYDENVLNTQQCTPIYIDVIGASSGGAASVMPDGQPTGSAVAVMSDGQPTGSAVAPVSQIPDGQPQATGAVTQISDGQPQAPSAVSPVQQISDGQVQATSAVSPVQQISDGQVQATSAAAPVQQISDGQIQATTAVSPVTQISDGQVQAPTAASSGYLPPSNTTLATPSVPVQSEAGAASLSTPEVLGIVAGFLGLFML